MKLENFKQTMKQYFEYMEACDRDGMLGLFAENAQIQDPPGVRGLGPPSKDAKPMTKQECGELWDHIFKEPRKTTGAMISAISSTVPNQYCGLIEFELEFEDGAKVPFFSVLICDMDHTSRKIVRYRNFLSGRLTKKCLVEKGLTLVNKHKSFESYEFIFNRRV